MTTTKATMIAITKHETHSYYVIILTFSPVILHCNSSFTLRWKLICIFFASESLWDFKFLFTSCVSLPSISSLHKHLLAVQQGAGLLLRAGMLKESHCVLTGENKMALNQIVQRHRGEGIPFACDRGTLESFKSPYHLIIIINISPVKEGTESWKHEWGSAEQGSEKAGVFWCDSCMRWLTHSLR